MNFVFDAYRLTAISSDGLSSSTSSPSAYNLLLWSLYLITHAEKFFVFLSECLKLSLIGSVSAEKCVLKDKGYIQWRLARIFLLKIKRISAQQDLVRCKWATTKCFTIILSLSTDYTVNPCHTLFSWGNYFTLRKRLPFTWSQMQKE